MSDDRKKYAYNYYIKKGVPPIQAAAIVGNLVKESNLDTSIKGTADNMGSVGIAQWHSGRLDNLKKFAGNNWTNLDKQLDFVLHELNTTEKSAFKKLMQAKTVEEATESFMYGYERPSSNPSINRISDRIKEARNIIGAEPTEYTPEETSTYKPYVSYLQENAGKIETAGKYSEPKEVTEAKKEIYQAQQEENFLEALSNLQQQPQQEAPQQEQSYLENPELFQLAQVPQIQYEQFQKGGKKVVYGTPEYEAAYNRGEVITDEGVRSPIQLDEVVVQNNYRRPRGFWEQYKDKIVEENKDAGVLGAIIGTPISAVASLPQLAMMKVMTGEMQRPSEAWGFSSNEEDSKVTKYGKIASNFVMDAVADPANIVGAGLLTKERALAGLAASKESGLLSNAYKLNPKAFKLNEENLYRQIGEQGYQDAVQTKVIRSADNKSYPNPYFAEAKDFDKLGSTGSGATGTRPDFIAEMPMVKEGELLAYPDGKGFWVAGSPQIPLEDVNLYKKDWLQGYKKMEQGGEIELQDNERAFLEEYFQDGGIIKDNNGYWNPNNWGKTVEISSPNITMKGVGQPLVGYAPETGETKIMLPGEDYFFNGANRVIESQLIK